MEIEQEKMFHVAIIMDGNGRWATRQNKPRFLGHQVGADRVREIVEAAVKMEIDVLTLYAFSADNWKRPTQEVEFIMRLFEIYLQSEIKRCLQNNIKLSVIGRRDRLKPSLVSRIEKAEYKTRFGTNLHLRVAIDYSSRYDLVSAIAQYKNNFDKPPISDISEKLQLTDVDFLIRTGGEQRLSDFLLWECAYAELYFSKVLWPDFDKQHFFEAMEEYFSRERRFGKIPSSIAV